MVREPSTRANEGKRGDTVKTIYKSSILLVRDLEDTIRATKKYTKGAFSRAVSHPIQGEQFPSKVLTEYYEVYPDLELGWDMRAGDAWAWVWGDVVHIDITFLYDYRDNKAKVTVHGGRDAMEKLKEGIPGFRAMLALIDKANNAKAVAAKTVARKAGVTDNEQVTNNNTSLRVTTKQI